MWISWELGRCFLCTLLYEYPFGSFWGRILTFWGRWFHSSNCHQDLDFLSSLGVTASCLHLSSYFIQLKGSGVGHCGGSDGDPVRYAHLQEPQSLCHWAPQAGCMGWGYKGWSPGSSSTQSDDLGEGHCLAAPPTKSSLECLCILPSEYPFIHSGFFFLHNRHINMFMCPACVYMYKISPLYFSL